MTDQEAPPSTRVTEAKTILEQSIKAVEVEDLVARIEDLERALMERGYEGLEARR
jgi:hypothetical protein